MLAKYRNCAVFLPYGAQIVHIPGKYCMIQAGLVTTRKPALPTDVVTISTDDLTPGVDVTEIIGSTPD